MNGKYAFYREYTGDKSIIERTGSEISAALEELRGLGMESFRLYTEPVEGHNYAFQFYSVDPEADAEGLFGRIRSSTGALEGWHEARHVYEFKLHPGDVYDGLKTDGIIIGVRPGTLDEYIRLHDEQPQIIHDLCYENGFRKSSIFVADLHKQYLLQFQEFSGAENPELYENETYQHWLKITGACQEPLPGEKFWKSMTTELDI